MFSTLDTTTSLRDRWPFASALLTQTVLLAALMVLSGGMGGVGRRAHIARSAHPRQATEIYFQPQTQAPPPPESQAPELAELKPELQTAHPEPPADNSARKDASDASDDQTGGDDLVSQLWELDAEPETLSVMHHQVRTAQPIFTPEPPILRHNTPASVRGKDFVLVVVITPDGSIAYAEVLQEVDSDVEQAIVETLRHWRFEPAEFAGRKVQSRRQLSFHFPG